MPTNEERAATGEAMIRKFQNATRMQHEPTQSVLVDLLTNLRHWAATDPGVDYSRAEMSSLLHYEAEADIEEGAAS